ncbi:MAG: SagB/ThcOx family dehydrogenase [Candidatus Lokiarchaeota archaeon]
MDINLPKVNHKGLKSLEECILERISVRHFKKKEIDLTKISQILWAAQGIRNGKRTVPSAGATYPLEIYIIIKNEGFFHYSNSSHNLRRIKSDDISLELAEAALNQSFIFEAPLNIIICANYKRTTSRYGNRGKKYVHIEVGHCAQNIHLQCVALGLSSVPIGAFEDKTVMSVLDLPDEIKPIYIIPIGYSKQ